MKNAVLPAVITALVIVLAAGPADSKAASHAQRCPVDHDRASADSARLERDRTAIEGLMASWARAVLEADLDTIGALVTEDAEFCSKCGQTM